MLAPDTLQQISSLAQIDIPENQREALQQQLGEILELVAQLQTIDTQGVAPMAHPFEPTRTQGHHWRGDQPQQPDSQQIDAAKKQAPEIEDGQFVVPAVINHNNDS